MEFVHWTVEIVHWTSTMNIEHCAKEIVQLALYIVKWKLMEIVHCTMDIVPGLGNLMIFIKKI